jgi:hypothetical protein
MVKNLAQQGVINLSGVRPQLAKGPTKTLQEQTQAPGNFIPVYLACVCVLRFMRWFWLSAPILPTITADNRESTVVGLQRGILSLASTIEELLGRKSSGSGLINQDYSHRDPPRWPRDTHLSAKDGSNFAKKRRSLGWYSSPRRLKLQLWTILLPTKRITSYCIRWMLTSNFERKRLLLQRVCVSSNPHQTHSGTGIHIRSLPPPFTSIA